MTSVKAHGALYEEVGKGGAVYEIFRDAVRDSLGDDVALVLPSGCRALAMVLRDGMSAWEEGFCDRAYWSDGGLVARSEPGAVLDDPAAAAAQALTPGPRRGRGRRRLGADPVGGHAVHARGLARRGGHRHRGAHRHGRGRDRSGCAGACMTPSVPVGEVRLLGDRAFLIGVADAAAARAVAEELTAALGGEAEVVCGAATVMVHAVEVDATSGRCWPWRPLRPARRRGGARRGHPVDPPRTVTIPCHFDGPDLEEVAALAGVGPDEVAAFSPRNP